MAEDAPSEDTRGGTTAPTLTELRPGERPERVRA
ncbi:hypothetical protein HMPREF9719_00842 [Corynebacterium otitidis ATCC 51513]|uniref:Uncharacterized protein n=1 Tax=Corynebacterium otitidis ATCC 51513 TaxID=883169 RepID=K0YFA5_9CORY|nr:hypothetical protein HMPREF9719_00842 [Corynebacterium otitidis ATCC 51513]